MFFNKQFTGAQLAVKALEQIGVLFTFGIPGVHNTELYDELEKSNIIQPILVTHEGGASFMADAVSRTSSSIGCLAIVPGAGLTHAMSGIAEAFLDGIPMLIISGGIKREIDKHYQLHELNQLKIAEGVTKGQFLVKSHFEVSKTIFEAYELAICGEPGPVIIEIPFEVMNYKENTSLEDYFPTQLKVLNDLRDDQFLKGLDLIKNAKKPVIYVGWGANGCTPLIIELAEILGAPVATTLQGLSVFPANHPLHVGMGFGKSAVPCAREQFEGHDCLIAIGVKFSELATGSFGINKPKNLIHIDINSSVFNKNYEASCQLHGDSKEVLKLILKNLESMPFLESVGLESRIEEAKYAYQKDWLNEKMNKVNPAKLFDSIRAKLPNDAIVVSDDGNHTFLTAELLPIYSGGQFISPTDFNCMGYAIPAAIGAKLANPSKVVVAVVGDGALLMTGMELLTASAKKLGILIFVFADRELGQIAQFQEMAYNHKSCTQLGLVNIEGLAIATGSTYNIIKHDDEIQSVVEKSFDDLNDNKPTLIEVEIDYSRKTCMTKGAAVSNFSRFPWQEKVRFLGRAVSRKIF